MKFSGTASLTAPPERVWEAFHDPDVLARCLPGVRSLTAAGDNAYAMTITAGVAAIKGTYDGTVSLHDVARPKAFTLKAAGAGAPGTVNADVAVTLRPSAAGGTDLAYEADAAVGGAIGGVGQRMLAGVSRKMAGQFFAAVDQDIAGVRAAAPAPALSAAGAPGAAAGGVPAAAHPAHPPAQAAPGPRDRAFALGVLAGGAIALAGVIVGWAIGGR